MEMLVSCRETDATCAIQQAIDACFLQGGGEVQIPEGKYSVTTLRLRSNVCLHLLENAQLIASRNCEDYEKFLEDTLEPVPEHDKSDADVWKGPPYEPDYEFFNKPGSRWNRGVIKALDAENISIIGEKGSVINGRDCYDALGEEDTEVLMPLTCGGVKTSPFPAIRYKTVPIGHMPFLKATESTWTV